MVRRNKRNPDRSKQQVPAVDVYLNRELSMLAFNERVLAMAARTSVPLAERLRYICILSSILDEFFEVRIADLSEEIRETRGASPLAPVYIGIMERAHQLVAAQYALYNQTIMPALERRRIVVLNSAQRDEPQRAWVRDYFMREVRPLLSPIGLDPSHPFPQVLNKSLNFILQLGGKDAFGRPSTTAILKVPRVLPRVIPLPARLTPGKQAFVLLSSVIRSHLQDVFPGREVGGFSQFRVTRDSDLSVDEREVHNLRQALRMELAQRHFGNAVRLEVLATCPPHLQALLQEQFQLPDPAVFRVDGPVNLVRLNQLVDQLTTPALRWAPFAPAWPAKLAAGSDMFEAMKRNDILLHHPFESFEPVIEFLRQAAMDPKVVAIRMTLYRTGIISVLVDILEEAARRGKEVTVVVELKARFDEEANINLAERLEAVGAQVVYGVVGLKIHAKLTLVLRREEVRGKQRLVPYAHLGTGNYHPTTTKLYTDFGMLTADADLCEDVEKVFMHLTSLTKVERLKLLWLAPFSLHRNLLAALDAEVALAKSGKPARVIAKMNALTDEATIQALYVASQAGVKIDLVVRGACALRPGVKGLSENIKVRSIVGRFLEHHRIYYFRNGGKPRVYLSSADWMGRNLFRRIEVAWPVLQPKLARRVIDEGLKPYLGDARDAWVLLPDGDYRPPRGGSRAYSAQQDLLTRLAASIGD
ncbi:MAG TPA: polyphosphate kinase 1 [Burkholderiaceae bacterium]|nr:polyphosphate kinase 1 [Burkholderiaceae bacterium]HQR70221.1 polyphosphate kinase 1 [Burkholderiaceae bacterium]